MLRDASATKRRILEAAIEEFAALGFSGARVDRIAQVANANKRMIYVYFTDKGGLFEAALDSVLGRMLTTVPVSEGSLAEYAGKLFDHLVAHPEALRLSMWRQLERPDGGPTQHELFQRKVSTMREHGASRDSPFAPFDLLVLVQGMASAWWSTPRDLLAIEGVDPEGVDDLRVHRQTLVCAVEQLESVRMSAVRLIAQSHSSDGFNRPSHAP